VNQNGESVPHVKPDYSPVDNLSTLPDITLLGQCYDWVRFGPLNKDLLWRDVEKRFGYIDLHKNNHFGRWYVDLTGDQLEVIRTVEEMNDVFRWLRPHHWTRLDVAFDLVGVEIPKLLSPGSAIVNDGVIQTLYSHKLTARGDHPVFARVYDAFEAGHDVAPNVVRAEVEFKLHYPDLIRNSPNGVGIAFPIAARYLVSKFNLAIPLQVNTEWQPTKRLINHDREKFYARFGRRIVLDLVELGFDQYVNWVLDCTRKVDDDGPE
jgi:hypothetical protein